MKRKVSLWCILLVINSIVFGQPGLKSQLNPTDLDIGSMVQPVPLKNKFTDEKYNIWCGSVTRGKNGKFYMLYSRWLKTGGHYAWVINCEVALAKSDRLEGPYKHVKVVLPARGNKFWDGSCTHNPAVMQYNGKYYLYYMGTTGKSTVVLPTSSKDPAWWEYRNNQRIGVAFADDPEGEWKRFDRPVIDVSPDSTAFDALMVSNPAGAVDDQGRSILVYKEVEKSNKLSGGKVRFGVAFASNPTGPFKKYEKPIFEAGDGTREWMVAEDPFIWYQKGTYMAIVRDVVGKFTGDSGALALLVSKDGKEWKPGKFPKVISSRFLWEDGSKSIGQLERPCLYIENGIPEYLFGAYGLTKDRNNTCNVAVPLKSR
jgi:predicted GH43/DUF377 family glycosyl hydrolase